MLFISLSLREVELLLYVYWLIFFFFWAPSLFAHFYFWVMILFFFSKELVTIFKLTLPEMFWIFSQFIWNLILWCLSCMTLVFNIIYFIFIFPLGQRSANFFYKEPNDKLFCVLSPVVAVTPTLSCGCSMKAATQNAWMDCQGWVPIKLYLQKEGRAAFGSQAIFCQSLL